MSQSLVKVVCSWSGSSQIVVTEECRRLERARRERGRGRIQREVRKRAGILKDRPTRDSLPKLALETPNRRRRLPRAVQDLRVMRQADFDARIDSILSCRRFACSKIRPISTDRQASQDLFELTGQPVHHRYPSGLEQRSRVLHLNIQHINLTPLIVLCENEIHFTS